MGVGNAAELPKRLLEPLGERRKALATLDDLDELPAAVGQPKMIEEVIERSAVDGDAKAGGLGEIGEGLMPRRVLLAENQLLLRTFGRPPHSDPSLQGPQQAVRVGAGCAARIAELAPALPPRRQ